MSDELKPEKRTVEGTWVAYGREYAARVSGERYAEGGGRAIEVETFDPEGRFWEPWCTATVNLPGNEPPRNCVWIKEHDDNGVTKDNLVKLGIIEDVSYVSTRSGFAEIKAYPLTAKGRSLWEHEGPWFDELGILIRKLPDECVYEVAAPAQDNEASAGKWVNKLDFAEGLDQDLARGHIIESGAHELLEVVAMSDLDVAKWILWDVCWDLRDAETDDPVVGMVDSRKLSQFLKDRVCKAWGYENGFDAGKMRMFAAAKKVHDKLVELHPDEHGENATDTVRGDHHRWCKCGFDYMWDSSD